MSGKKTVLSLITCLLALSVFLQTNAQNSATAIEWQRCYGWDSWYGDEGVRIAPSQDGNYITTGKKTLNGYESIVASKVNSRGELLWETIIFDNQIYTGFRGVDIIQNSDGGYILIAKVVSVQRLNFVSTNLRNVDNTFSKGYYDILITKLNAQGQRVWFKILGGAGEDMPIRVLPSSDNNIMLLGYTTSADQDMNDSGKNTASYNRDIWVAKISQNGDIMSKKCFGGNNDDLPFDMKRTSDGNYVIVGSTNSDDGSLGPNKGAKDIFTLKINESLATIWKKTYGGNQNDEARSVIALPNGDLVVGIVSNSLTDDFFKDPNNDFPNNYQENAWLFKLNSGGNFVDSRIFGGSGRDFINDLILTRDGSYVFVGSTTSNNGSITDRNRIPSNNNDKFDVFLMKINSSFDIVWEKTMGGSEDDEGSGLVETTDETLITTGTTKSFNGDVNGNHASSQDPRDIWLVKLSYPCQPEVTTSIDLVSANTDVIASESIHSSDRISDNSSVRYSANKNVDLTAGFNIEPGSVLEVNLQGCTNGTAGISGIPIQIKTNNACREGGMKFTFHPFTPDNDLSQYRMSIQNLDPSIEFKFSGNALITKNNSPDNHNAYYLLTVSRNGYKDFVIQGYTSTCDHDDAPLNCPENTDNVILDKQYYNEGDTFTATWTGELIPDQTLEWYNDNVTMISKNGKTMTGRINGFPAHLQAQPGVFATYRPCHGAVRVELRKVE
ncbi:3-coathanger stack domain-containing protein [Emticicia sp. C21]|uniref:3-coathanger stack domain-containing protein n=1 Tax=Emticicia sp. C21 TaxID=2302915 RepID=UPI000E3480CA|nr:3-coathanger stack domain-containing protein [Emticicia sp. C21]RFS15352.1 hypothetical protein D0T08_17685 [Emticicia sp. C21]